MMTFDFLRGALTGLIEAGGWVVSVQVLMSILGIATLIWKLWQFASLGVGRHAALEDALGAGTLTEKALAASPSHLAPPLRAALQRGGRDRAEAELAAGIARLEGGFRIFDSIAQLAPLLGLFGTVLGMISAFQAMQAAGTATDPAVLAGGIWVALLTTAVGLAVGMPASVVLTWLEGRVSRERVLANRLVAALPTPDAALARQREPRLRDAA